MVHLLLGVLLLAGMALPLPAAGESAYDARNRLIAPDTPSQGEFALALALALGVPLASEDENEAMRALSGLGIEPFEGWEPGLPMTPRRVAELRHAVSNAAAGGRFDIDRAVALAAFDDLIADLGLPLPDERPPAYAGAAPGYGDYCDRAALDHYYGAVGPPYYTYCPPPPAYYYMYSWVPSRFYLHGVFFSGFFVLRDVHVVPRFKHPRFKHRPPRFSHGVIGDRRAHAPRAFPDRGKGFRDIARSGKPPIKVVPHPPVPRAIPRAPDRPRFSHRPRFSEGVLGARRDAPRAATPPPLASRATPPSRASMPAHRPDVRMGPVLGGSRATSPSVSGRSPATGRGWRNVVVPGRR